jgi:hypothetical protein
MDSDALDDYHSCQEAACVEVQDLLYDMKLRINTMDDYRG